VLRARLARVPGAGRSFQFAAGHLVDGRGELLIALLPGMQVHPCGPGGGMAHAAHQLGQRGAGLGSERVPGMAEIMNVDFGREPSLGQCPRPGLGEVAAPELAALDADEHETIWAGRRELV
jgi:hypothetical protein